MRTVAPRFILSIATFASSVIAPGASAERLRFDGHFNVQLHLCDDRSFECLRDEWLKQPVAAPIAPIEFSFTIDVTDVRSSSSQTTTVWSPPTLVPRQFIDATERDAARNVGPQPYLPLTKETFDGLTEARYTKGLRTSSSAGTGELFWESESTANWSGLVEPWSQSDQSGNAVGFGESISIKMRGPGTSTSPIPTFAELAGLFDHYLATQRAVDLQASFGFSRLNSEAIGDAATARLAGNFRLVEITCRAPSALGNLAHSLKAQLTGGR